jgi:hypothetical protein
MISTKTFALLLLLIPLVIGCDRGEAPGFEDRTAKEPATRETPRDAFWANLQSLCPGAAEGEVIQVPEGDTQIPPDAGLVVHFRECGERELRFPVHVNDNRSRTWVFIRHDDSLELRHDHRYEDGTEESNTWYGAHTIDEGTSTQQEFIFERDGMQVGWRVEVEPGERYTYGTIREGAWRHHLVFDLGRTVDAPPPPWGHETRPSQRPTPEG